MIEPSREVDAEQLRRIRDWAGVDGIRPAEPLLVVTGDRPAHNEGQGDQSEDES